MRPHAEQFYRLGEATLADTGPLVALLDESDAAHADCVRQLRDYRGILLTTTPVLAEAFHLLRAGSPKAAELSRWIAAGGLRVWFLDDGALLRCLALMGTYADLPMDFADASLVTAAERVRTHRIFTLDRRDFLVYRVRRGHRLLPFEIV